MVESFSELFEKSISENKLSLGEVVSGKIIAVDDKFVTVDTGLKSETLIPIEQFKNERGALEVKVGDKVDVTLESFADGYGETSLSREKAKRAEAWRDLEAAHKQQKTVTGYVSGRVKGGFTVEIGALKGFLPGSLVDVRPVRDPSYLEGKNIDVRIIKMDQKRNNVVVSRRAVMEAESHEERSALLDKLEEGQEVKGVVKNLTDYGAFVDLGGVDGLLHITDMSWKRVKHPNEIVNVGDEIRVKILKFDRDRNRVSLGLKQLGEDPWMAIKQRYPVNSRLRGKVSNIADYGCFVELEDGVEGLVHVSEMDWTNKNVNPNKVVNLGDEVDVMVLEIDEDKRRISLGIKQCQSNPWRQFSDKHHKGETITGNIKSITDFGIFIGLDGNIDGLVHLSDISWSKPGEQAIHDYKKGQEVETLILAIDPERERISLGIKQLESNPFGAYQEVNPKGTLVHGTVTHVDAKKVTVDLAENITGIIKAADLAQEKVKDPNDYVKVGDDIDAIVIGYDNKNTSVNLSMKARHSAEIAEESGYGRSDTPMGTTIGDLLKEKLENKE